MLEISNSLSKTQCHHSQNNSYIKNPFTPLAIMSTFNTMEEGLEDNVIYYIYIYVRIYIFICSPEKFVLKSSLSLIKFSNNESNTDRP